MSIGSKIKEQRLKRGESLQQVADAVDSSKPHIWELEGGRRTNPSLDLLKRLAEHFNVTIAYLIGEDKDSETSEYSVLFREADKKLDAKNKEIAAELISKMLEMQKKEKDGNN